MNDKFVIVTGASTGIGRAAAMEFGKRGAVVGIVARRVDKLKETKDLVENAGGKAEIFIADLSDLDSVNQLISDIKARTNKVDALVNVAGIWHGKDEVYAGKNLENFDQKTILDTYMVGFTSPTLLIHGLIDLLKGGKVINISGTFESGAKGWLPYYASKRGLEDLTVGLAEELAHLDIAVNCISPSDVATEQYKKFFPEYAKDALKPEDVSVEIAKLYDESSSVTGKIFVVKKDEKTKESFHL